MGDIAQRGNRLTFARGGRAGFQSGKKVGHKRTGNTQRENRLEELGRVDSERAWTRHGKRDLRLERHRIRDELKHGGKPWGAGPKPGTLEFLQHHTQTPKRKRKAVGGVIKGVGKLAKEWAKEPDKAKRFLDFIKTGKTVDKHGVKVNVAKAAERLTGKPHVDHGKRKRIKHLGRGKAAGGRIGRAVGGWTKVIPRTFKKLDFPGDRTGKPHSSREGRKDSWVRGARRALESAKKIKEKMKPQRPSPQPLAKGGKADKKWIQKAVNPKHKGYCTPMTKKTCTPRRKALARTFKKKAKTGW